MSQKKAATLGQKIVENLKSKEMRDYFMSTHFWGPVANWGIPLAAIADIRSDPKYISGKMTLALTVYSGVFMRFALKVKPKNMLLFACHVTNATVQTIQGVRYIKYQFSSDKKSIAVPSATM
ncbi:mitochondrial pyruvate carrier 1-like [Glossina fuscipes]|uniref:Mitochondrial pyruvate carrier n=1 Tax=Glossina fuscipes TaxID=7396 RepID=A0A9C6DY40_9MUSC|nr:mitochondrial pyruvate carrier 1-like [Glossina fuscipes]